MNQTVNKRLLALDVLRGITIAGMIMVNNPGSWSYVYAPLGHAAWIGLTPTDLDQDDEIADHQDGNQIGDIFVLHN